MKQSNTFIQNGPGTITVDFTYSCTMRCLHCFNSSGQTKITRNELTDEEIMLIAQDIVLLQPTTVCICGGEPLTRPKLVIDFIKYIVSKSNGQIVVNMVSNGELLTSELARQLNNAGISNVQISIDGHDKISHDWLRNKKGAFDKAISAIQLLNNEGLSISVACTPTKSSINNVEKIIDLCESLGVKLFRMQPLMLMGRAKDNLKSFVPNDNEYRELSNKLKKYRYRNVECTSMQIQWGDPIEHLIKISNPVTEYTKFIGISAYGDIMISPYLPATVGNVRKHKISEYWRNGLNVAWRSKWVKEISSLIRNANMMDANTINSNLPETYRDEFINVDFINEREKVDMNLTEILQLGSNNEF